MYPGNSKYLLNSFQDATSVQYGYLVIDLKQDTDDVVRLRTEIFPNENTYIYIAKEQANHLATNSLEGCI